MSTNFPNSIDQIQNPVATDNTATVSHAGQHSNENDAIESLETKLGVDSSAVTSTIDYKLKSSSSVNPGHKHSLASAISDVVITSPVNGNGLTFDGTNWVNSTSTVPDASTSVKGITALSYAPASSSNPIAVGDNDPRMTLATQSTTAYNASTNKLIDNAMVASAKTASKIPIRDANGDVLVATTPTSTDAACSKTYVDASALQYGASGTGVQYSNLGEISGAANSGSKVFTLLVPAIVTIVADCKQDTDGTGSPTLTLIPSAPLVTTAIGLAGSITTSYATYTSSATFLPAGKYSVQVTSTNGRIDYLKNLYVKFTPTLMGTTFII